MEEVNGRVFGSNILGEKDENGDWKVTVSMFERRRVKGDEWQDKDVSTACTDSTFEKAYNVAVAATLQKYKDIIDANGGNGLFEEDSDSQEDDSNITMSPVLGA